MPDGHDDHVEVTPFPVLTSGQRLFFEVNGYVVVENTLAPDEIQRTKDALLELRRKFEDSGDPLNFNLNTSACPPVGRTCPTRHGCGR